MLKRISKQIFSSVFARFYLRIIAFLNPAGVVDPGRVSTTYANIRFIFQGHFWQRLKDLVCTIPY